MLEKVEVGKTYKIKLKDGSEHTKKCIGFFPVKGAFQFEGWDDLYRYRGNIGMGKHLRDMESIEEVKEDKKSK